MALAAAILVDQIVGCMSAAAQMHGTGAVTISSPAEVPATPDDLIVQMSRSAAVIFVGRVAEVRQPAAGFSGSPEAAAEGIVEVEFFVDQAVRGPAQGSVYTLREWGGLWAGGAGRYRVGQRLLLMLHVSDSTGLASPVHGAEGLIPLRGAGQAPGPDDDSSTQSPWMVDVRWLQAQTLQNQVRLVVPGRRSPIPIRKGLRSEVSGAVEPLVRQSYDPLLVHALLGPWLKPASLVAQGEPLSHVLALCASSTGPQDASR
jgi:hypothetical protein